MIILEGIRRSGKSFTLNVLKEEFPELIHYKDLGIRMIDHNSVEPDDYAFGRDLAYAQFISCINDKCNIFDKLLFDRSYWSSYVYGQCWRNKYSKRTFTEHVKRVESVYGNLLNSLKVVYISVDDDALNRIKTMDRNKDQWENTRKDYERQMELYDEILDITGARVFELKAFLNKEDTVSQFAKIIMA